MYYYDVFIDIPHVQTLYGCCPAEQAVCCADHIVIFRLFFTKVLFAFCTVAPTIRNAIPKRENAQTAEGQFSQFYGFKTPKF